MPAKKKKIEKLQDDVKLETAIEIESELSSETISKKKIIYIEIDDEVTAVYDKIKKVNAKHVYVVAPKRSILFQSIVNLRILKRKAEDDVRKLYLITSDSNGIHLAQKVGIEVYNKANEEDSGPALFSTEMSDERLRITPLRASVNDIEDDIPTRMTERKLSISEVLRKTRKKPLDVSKIERGERKAVKKPKFVIIAPNRHALIGLVAASLVILLVIIYVALPGVTVYLTPAASVLEKSVNITLADYQKNRSELETRQSHMIASYPINTDVNKTLSHFATGKKFSDRGANSSGKITIFNISGDVWPLIAKTRFQTDDGIVFRLASAVTVPAASAGGPGKFEAFVTADQLDALGLITGERGNIEPSRFFLPGLREDSRSKIYAESYEAMSGGVTDFITFISAEDLEAAQARLKDELVKNAVESLKLAVKEKGELTGGEVVYSLLEGEKAINISEPKVEIDGSLEGKQLEEFTVSGSLSVDGVYYDKNQMLEILKSELLLKKSPQKELLKVNEDSTSYRIFEWDSLRGKIKLTANIKGIEQFEIDPSKENGARLLDKMREHIVGKDIESAKSFIQNLPEVNKVEIDSWPAWAPTIPNIPDNIDFEIRSTVMQ